MAWPQRASSSAIRAIHECLSTSNVEHQINNRPICDPRMIARTLDPGRNRCSYVISKLSNTEMANVHLPAPKHARRPMIRPIVHARLCSLRILHRTTCVPAVRRSFSNAQSRKEDPRLQDIGRVLKDEYAVVRERYGTDLIHVVNALLTLARYSCIVNVRVLSSGT